MIKRKISLALFALVALEISPSAAQSPPFNGYSISSLGGNCALNTALVYQGPNLLTKCGPAGAEGQLLMMQGGVPTWVNGTPGLGTVTSVGMAMPSIFSVSGSPVTSGGTLTAALASQTANQFFVAPNGSNGAPSFRAMVAADMPADQRQTGVSINVGTLSANPLTLFTNNGGRFQLTSGGDFLPFSDNLYDIGSATQRVNQLYSANAIIDTRLSAGTDNTWWNTYLPGAASATGIRAAVVNPAAVWGSFLSAIRSSDNSGAANNLIADTCLGVADNTSIGHKVWCRYSEGIITATGVPGLYMGEENSVKNLAADAPALDPFSTAGGGNPAGMVLNLRLNNGIGDGTVSNKISAFLNMTNNSLATAGAGGYAKAGLVIAADALDTSSGTGTAISMGPNHAIDWYNGAASRGWRIRKNGNAGTGEMILGNNRFDMTLNNGAVNNFRVTTTGVGVDMDPTYKLDVNGQVRAKEYFVTSATQTLSSCGTSPTMASGSSKMAGRITTGTGTVNSCTLTFDAAFPTNAFCVVAPVNASGTGFYISAQTASSFTITFGASSPSTSWQYICNGN